jgi:hypothetical protein
MDKFDIAVSMLSMTQMGDVLYDNTEKGRKAVRTGNDYGAKVMADHPKRFGLLMGVPLPDIDGVMKKIEYGSGEKCGDRPGAVHSKRRRRAF